MSNTSIPGLSVRDLAATITQKLDADKDGKLSSSEFAEFLTQFLGTPRTGTGSSPGATSSLTELTRTTSRVKVGTLGGYDPVKLANESHKSAKYEVGRILQYYPNTPEGLKAAMPEIQQLAPDARIVGSRGTRSTSAATSTARAMSSECWTSWRRQASADARGSG